MTRDTDSYILVHVAYKIAEFLQPELRVFPPEDLDRVDALEFLGICRQQRLEEPLAQIGDVGVVVGEGLEEEGPVDDVVYLGSLEEVVKLVELLDRVERTTEEKARLLAVSWRYKQSLHLVEDGSNVLRVTVAICSNICRNIKEGSNEQGICIAKTAIVIEENALEQLVERPAHTRFHQSVRNDTICLHRTLKENPTIDSWFSHIRCLQMGHFVSDYASKPR